MIRVVIKGGLGNQMFQYAYAKVLAKKFSQDLLLDLSFYEREDNYRSFALKRIGVEENITNKKPKKFVLSIWKRLLPINLWLLKKGFKPLSAVYLDGYWQSEKFFVGEEELVRSLFKFPSPPQEMVEQVSNTNSVAVHIRRGDYLNFPLHLICQLDYYLDAMRQASEKISKAKFFIFSDDLEWCEKEILAVFPDAVLVNQCESDLEELHLMMMCKNMVMSNSSFSWWGAWMKDYSGKVVLSPNRWVNDEAMNHMFMVEEKIIPDRWFMLEV